MHIVFWKRLPDDPQSPVVCTSKTYFLFVSFLPSWTSDLDLFFNFLWTSVPIILDYTERRKNGVRNSSTSCKTKIHLLLKNNISRKHTDESIFLYFLMEEEKYRIVVLLNRNCWWHIVHKRKKSLRIFPLEKENLIPRYRLR